MSQSNVRISNGLIPPVNLADFTTISANRVIGSVSGGTPIELTPANVATLLNGTNLGTPSALILTNATSMPLSGMASQAEATIVGRVAGAGTGVPSALTAAQVKTIIGQMTLVGESILGAASTNIQISFTGVAGTRYFFDVSLLNTGGGVFRQFINGDSTSTNYGSGYNATSGASNSVNNGPEWSVSSGNILMANGFVELFSSRVMGQTHVVILPTNVAQESDGWQHDTANTLTSIEFVGSVASSINIGSRLRVWSIAP